MKIRTLRKQESDFVERSEQKNDACRKKGKERLDTFDGMGYFVMM